MRTGTGIAACVWTTLVAFSGLTGELAASVEEYVNVREHRDAVGKSRQRVTISSLPDGRGFAAHSKGDGGDGEETRTPLWTFTDPDLGQAHDRVRIALSNAEDARGDREWAAIFGSGDGIVAGEARLFVLFIDRGIDGWSSGDFVEIPTGVRTPGDGTEPPLSNGLGEPALVDRDLDGSTDLAYAGDMQGNLYRFDISGRDPSLWRAVRLFKAEYGGPPGTHQPITQRPFVVMHPGNGEFLVVFATGGDLTGGGRVSTDIQSIYGIWDPGESDPVTAHPDARDEHLVRRVLINVVDESAGSFKTRRMLTGDPVHYARRAPGRMGVYGWYIDLDMPRARRTLQGNPNPDRCGGAPPGPQYPGEQVTGRPVPRGKVLFMVTAIPGDTLQCTGAPPGSLLAIDMVTGNRLVAAVLDLNGDESIDAEDLVPFAGETPASGIVLDNGIFTGPPAEPGLVSSRDGSAMLVFGEGTDAPTLAVGGGGELRTGRLSWREIPDTAR